MKVLLCVGSGIGNVILQVPLYKYLLNNYGDNIDIFVSDSCPRSIINYLSLITSKNTHIFFQRGSHKVNSFYDLVFETRSFTGGKDSKIIYNAAKKISTKDYFSEVDYRIYDETQMEFEVLRISENIEYKIDDLILNDKKKVFNKKIAIFNTSKSGFQTKRKIDKFFFDDLIIRLQEKGFQIYSFGLPKEYVQGTINKTCTDMNKIISGINECSYFIAPDMGLSFVSISLGLNGTMLFGPTSHYKMLEPISRSKINVISNDSICSYFPCYLTDVQHRNCDMRCIKSIENEQTIINILNHIDSLNRKK